MLIFTKNIWIVSFFKFTVVAAFRVRHHRQIRQWCRTQNQPTVLTALPYFAVLLFYITVIRTKNQLFCPGRIISPAICKLVQHNWYRSLDYTPTDRTFRYSLGNHMLPSEVIDRIYICSVRCRQVSFRL